MILQAYKNSTRVRTLNTSVSSPLLQKITFNSYSPTTRDHQITLTTTKTKFPATFSH